MTKDDAKKRIKKLREQIADFRYRYHVENDPNITDDMYESLTRELKKIENEYPDLVDLNSSINRVAGKPLDKFSKVKHAVRMLSLNDCFSLEELESWEKRIEKLIPSSSRTVLKEASKDRPSPAGNYFCEIKYDGLAVSLTYEKGNFVRGSTRGDGLIGEDITENLKMIENIPLSLIRRGVRGEVNPVPDFIEVRGEAVMSKSVLVRINKKNLKEGKSPFANTRNAAAGSLRQLDSNIVKERHLDFFAYDIAQILPLAGKGQTLKKSQGLTLRSHSDKHQLLRDLGFEMSEYEKICKNLSEVSEFIDKIGKIRGAYPYGTDGVVISIDNLEIENSLGIVGKAPRYMAAYKYPAERATTIVIDIKVNVGRTGVLTPIAIFEPTLVAGSIVGKATLHNMDQIERLDIRIGDTIVIQKAGDVIPEVVMVLPKMRTGKEKKFKMPEKCPVCGSGVERRSGLSGEVSRSSGRVASEVSQAKQTKLAQPDTRNSTTKTSIAYYCINQNCPAKNRRGMQHFVTAFEIYEVGPKVLDRLKDEGLISDAADLFTLKKEDIALLERFGEKSAENIVASIEEHKKIPLWRFLYSLGILHVGEQTAKDLSEHFGLIEKIKNAKLSELSEIENIGPVVAKSVYDFFQQKENQNFVDKLFRNGVVALKGEKKKQGKFTNQTFVITGTLSSMSREKAKEEILKLGGKTSSSISKETDYLVAGEAPGSKLEKAQGLGVKILNESEFVKLLGK